MAESWSAARASQFPSFPREALPFPPHSAGLKGCWVPSGPGLRGHTVSSGGLSPGDRLLTCCSLEVSLSTSTSSMAAQASAL